MWITLGLVCIIILHVAGPFPGIFRLSIVNEITPPILISCLFHGFVEEILFRYCFWEFIPKDHAARHRTSLVWLNVLVFWLLHVLLQYHARYYEHSTSQVYESTSYHLSVIFFGMLLNAAYLESSGNTLATCIFIHSVVLILWSVFLGGNEGDFYQKYKPPQIVAQTGNVLREFMRNTKIRFR